MAMLCPICKGSYKQRLQCPRCGVRLLYDLPGPAGEDEPETLNPQTSWRRLLGGLLLAQGVFQALRHLYSAGILAMREVPGTDAWSALGSILMMQGLQAVSVFLACMFAGAGQQRGWGLGAVIGVWNGIVAIVIQHWSNPSLPAISLFGEPILQAAFGALGGFLGSVIWRPLPVLDIATSPPAVSPVLSAGRFAAFAGPVAWGRILTGITVAAGGVIWSDVIQDFILGASEGKLKIDTHLQAALVTWEISALAILTGAALAGFGTRNGLKQGLFVGIGTAVILAGLSMSSPNPRTLLPLLGASPLCLGLVGGWFGSRLLPPVYPRSYRSEVGSYMS
jgi:hypothetical protein